VFASKLFQLNNFYMEDIVLSKVSDEVKGSFESSDDRLKHCQPMVQVIYALYMFNTEKLT